MSAQISEVLGRLFRRAAQSGWGVVTQVLRPGEIRLAGRPERVLVAGPRTPEVGERVAWLRAEDGSLVIPMQGVPALAGPRPGPTINWIGEAAYISWPGQEEDHWTNVHGAIGMIGSDLWSWLSSEPETLHRRLAILRGQFAQLLTAEGWSEAGSHTFEPVTGPGGQAKGGPAPTSACLLRDGSTLWWLWNEDWDPYTSGLPDYSLYALLGTVSAGSLSLGSPVALPRPEIGGFGPWEPGGSCGMMVGPDGHYWAVATFQMTPGIPVVRRIWGDDLTTGWHFYSVGNVSDEEECFAGSGAGTTATDSPLIGLGSEPDIFYPLGGIETASGGGFGGPHIYGVRVTYYKDDDTGGDGETTASQDIYGTTASFDVAAGQTKSLHVTVRSGPANTTGRRIYIATDSGPSYLALEVAGNAEQTVEISGPPGSGTTMPTSNSLHRRRVWICGFGAPGQGPDGTTARRVYALRPAAEEYVKVGDVQGNDWGMQVWPNGLVDAGAAGDAPPEARADELFRAVAVGRSNSPGTWADGVTWETVEGWTPIVEAEGHYDVFHVQKVALCSISGGRMVALYGSSDAGLSGRVRSAEGIWGARQDLLSDPGYDHRLGSAQVAAGVLRVAVARMPVENYDTQWRTGTINFADDMMTLSLGDAFGTVGADPHPRLTWVVGAKEQMVQGIDGGPVAHAYRMTKGGVEIGTGVSVTRNPWSFTAPMEAPATGFAALAWVGDGIIAVRWRAR